MVEAEGAFGKKRGVRGELQLQPHCARPAAAKKLEVHVFDFEGDLYGQRLNVRFLHKLRDERKFDSIDALQAQNLGRYRCRPPLGGSVNLQAAA